MTDRIYIVNLGDSDMNTKAIETYGALGLAGALLVVNVYDIIKRGREHKEEVECNNALRKALGEQADTIRTLREQMDKFQKDFEQKANEVIVAGSPDPQEVPDIPAQLFVDLEKNLGLSLLKSFLSEKVSNLHCKFEITKDATKKEVISILRGMCVSDANLVTELNDLVAKAVAEKAAGNKKEEENKEEIESVESEEIES